MREKTREDDIIVEHDNHEPLHYIMKFHIVYPKNENVKTMTMLNSYLGTWWFGHIYMEPTVKERLYDYLKDYTVIKKILTQH